MSVKEYIEKHDSSPLRFSNYYKEVKQINFEDEKSLEDMIYDCLNLTGEFYSLSENNRIETGPEKARSSLDIWRHVKYFRPETTIYQILNSMYNIHDKLVGHYCFGIHRRVFSTAKLKFFWELLGQGTVDEYNLFFSNWKDISEETDK